MARILQAGRIVGVHGSRVSIVAVFIGALVAGGSWSAAGCVREHAVAVWVHLSDEVDAAAVSTYTVRAYRGGCPSEHAIALDEERDGRVHGETFAANGRARAIGQIDVGTYSFTALVRDAACRPIAFGCVTVDVGPGLGSEIQIDARPLSWPDAATRCAAGLTCTNRGCGLDGPDACSGCADAGDGAPAPVPGPALGRIEAPGIESIVDIAVDGAGNLYVAGTFDRTLALDGFPPLTSAGGQDVFLASFSRDGTTRWARSFGSASADDAIGAIAVDAAGTVTAIGTFHDTVDFGAGPLTALGSSDIFVARYRTGGGPRWSKRFGGAAVDSAYANDTGSGIAVDAAGRVAITGSFRGSIDFGAGALASAAGSNVDAFIAVLDNGGDTALWSASIGERGYNRGVAVAFDAEGNLYVTGYYEGAPVAGAGALPPATVQDTFVASFAPSGTARWARGYGGVGFDWPSAIAAAADGSAVYAVGFFEQKIAPGPSGQLFSAGSRDAIVVALDAAGGTTRWARRFGGGGCDRALEVIAAPDSRALVSGVMVATVDFGAGHVLASDGGGEGEGDAFIVGLSAASGETTSALRAGGALTDHYRAMALDGSFVWAAGDVDGSLWCGGVTPVREGRDAVLDRIAR